jgi:metal-responsive CopG/Arc/MetJ family transcriptional regulator
MAEATIAMWYITTMAAKPVQISIDTDLLERIDRDPEARTRGRSAFVRSAVERYLAAKERREIEAQIAAAYRDRADSVLEETADLLDAQEWPAE